jgi:DNA-directed RNA polymerase subunit M/transcription elongation factor TFIIS
MKFCRLCNNILHTNIYNEELTFKCISCYKIYKSDDKDTLRYQFSKNSNLGIYERQLKTAQYDPTNIKAFIDCPKCKHYICKQVELDTDLKLFNVCEKCGNIWLYGD